MVEARTSDLIITDHQPLTCGIGMSSVIYLAASPLSMASHNGFHATTIHIAFFAL
jgi:hypothetical protein